MAQPIQPLRIKKSNPGLMPNKMAPPPTQRPLAELGPMERRRNSPSYDQATKRNLFQKDSSPFDSSPLGSNSPRAYWQNRDPPSPTRSNIENRNPVSEHEQLNSSAKRSSIENLKRASRVKNSNMFAREHKEEYDPTSSPKIERPLASGRPLNLQGQSLMYGGKKVDNLRHEPPSGLPSGNALRPLMSPTKLNGNVNDASAPNRMLNSPTKSSLSSKSRYANAHAFDPETSIWDDEEDSYAERQLPPGKSLHRHAKSVTFDAAPPEVNEYEMATPDPSSVASGSRDGSHDSTEDEEDEESFDRGSSYDQDDSFDASLEDTEKTPVVLPEDWRFMSPAAHNDTLATKVDDPFAENASGVLSNSHPEATADARGSPARTNSTASDGERRPLPPLPASLNMPGAIIRERSDSVHTQRTAASPSCAPTISKAELQGMGSCSMPIEERLRLMMIQDEASDKVATNNLVEVQSPPTMSAGKFESTIGIEEVRVHEHEVHEDEIADFEDFKMPPRISRESILQKVKDRSQESEPTSASTIDPDVPLPTTETDNFETDVVIKQEADNEANEVDVYSIPELYNSHMEAESYMNAMAKLEAIQQARTAADQHDEDDQSHYSVDSNNGRVEGSADKAAISEDEGPPTPRAAADTLTGKHSERRQSRRMSLPQFAALLGDQDFGLGMESFLTPSPPSEKEPIKNDVVAKPSWSSSVTADTPSLEGIQFHGDASAAPVANEPITPEEQLCPPQFPGQAEGYDEPGTPDSVIKHPIDEASAPESPGIPEPVATIKSSGSRLKTRPSATPADIRAMAETRRQVSGELPDVPSIPTRHLSRPSVVREGDEGFGESGDALATAISSDPGDSTILRQPKRKSSLIPLDLQVEDSDQLGYGIESEFDRVVEAQKKGYLMRQNTKVIVASSASHESATSTEDTQESTARGTRSAGSSPRKPSQTKTWTTEPWNGKIRRKSIRQSGGSPSKRQSIGPAPPLPGQESNVASGLESVNEDETSAGVEEIGEDGERGRLFVKVVRVKDLDLPLPKGERSYFALTLDNGLHCVTTSWLELGKTAPIGQEFELVVLEDLEFQLTLQTKLEEPKPKPVLESPTKASKIAKQSTFSRVFQSPKKRKELELKQQEEAQKLDRQRQQEAQINRRSAQPTAWDLLHNLVAKDGSFARSYVCLKDHESSAYGKPFTVDVPCFNEWATEDTNMNSVKSKRSTTNGGVQRKAPYRVGKLELQLLYVPKPKGAQDEDMPKSMNACIRELKEAEAVSPKKWEGHLSQQGGDCPYWRRRFFTLDGTKFTAYHEMTRQPRATINLAKASKLIDDKSALMRSDASPKKGGRRKSAFAEEEEGYMFVEEGFRMRFANGETIDFYADSAAEKDGWMVALAEVVGKDPNKAKTWTDLVLANHRAAASRAKQVSQGQAKIQPAKSAPSPTKSAPPTPAKNFIPKPAPIPEKNPRRSDVAQRRSDAAAKTRSLIF